MIVIIVIALIALVYRIEKWNIKVLLDDNYLLWLFRIAFTIINIILVINIVRALMGKPLNL